VRESLQNIIDHKQLIHLSYQQSTQQLLESASVTYATKQKHQLQLTRLEKLKLELLFEEKLLKYETSLEESESQQLEDISNNLEELLGECKTCQQSIDTMSELIEDKKDELLKVKVEWRDRSSWKFACTVSWFCSLFLKPVS
jgi:hypothetical protein